MLKTKLNTAAAAGVFGEEMFVGVVGVEVIFVEFV